MAAHRVEISGGNDGFRKVSFTLALQEAAGLSLADAKRATDRVLKGIPVSVNQPSWEAAGRLAERLSALGAVAAVHGASHVASDAEFFEDFGDSLQPSELLALLERARQSDDRDLRLLVKQYVTLQRAAADCVAYLEARDPHLALTSTNTGDAVDYPIGFLRWLVRDQRTQHDS